MGYAAVTFHSHFQVLFFFHGLKETKKEENFPFCHFPSLNSQINFQIRMSYPKRRRMFSPDFQNKLQFDMLFKKALVNLSISFQFTNVSIF